MRYDEAIAAKVEGWRERVDLDALLVALVLVPHSFPRNRFYALYREPEARRVRRRAALLRSLVADLADDAEDVTLTPTGERTVRLRYQKSDVGAVRVTRLNRDELALVSYALKRVGGSLDAVSSLGGSWPERVDDALERIEPSLWRLFE
jgi:hypothetical protein